MARSRNIKPGFFKNEVLLELPFEARLLFIGIWTIADREGRLEDRPKRIKIELFPADNVDVDAALQALDEKDFIQRYEVGGHRYIQVLKWNKHQQPHFKEKASTIPAPDKPGVSTHTASGQNPGLAPDKPGTSRSDSLIPDSFQKKPPDGGVDPKSQMWKTGVAVLLAHGMKNEAAARAFLGQFAKDETKLAGVIGYLAANPKVEPKAYIVAAMTGGAKLARSASEAFNEIRQRVRDGKPPGNWTHPQTEAAMEAVGGWQFFKTGNTRDIDFKQRAFEGAFARAA